MRSQILVIAVGVWLGLLATYLTMEIGRALVGQRSAQAGN